MFKVKTYVNLRNRGNLFAFSDRCVRIEVLTNNIIKVHAHDKKEYINIDELEFKKLYEYNAFKLYRTDSDDIVKELNPSIFYSFVMDGDENMKPYSLDTEIVNLSKACKRPWFVVSVDMYRSDISHAIKIVNQLEYIKHKDFRINIILTGKNVELAKDIKDEITADLMDIECLTDNITVLSDRYCQSDRIGLLLNTLMVISRKLISSECKITMCIKGMTLVSYSGYNMLNELKTYSDNVRITEYSVDLI